MVAMTLTPKNWGQFQHYKDRAPPWIKLHKCLLDDYKFACLPVASRALAPCIWLLASEYEGGQITASVDEIAFRVRLTKPELVEALTPLIDNGFLIASTALAEGYQAAAVETETETEIQVKKEETTLLSPNGDMIPAFDAYNEMASRLGLPMASKLNDARRKKLRARLKEHGLQGWHKALGNLELMPFCLGQNNRGWKASLDFLLQPASFQKVLEGAFAGRERRSKTMEAARRMMEELDGNSGSEICDSGGDIPPSEFSASASRTGGVPEAVGFVICGSAKDIT
jgi:hypothetical protein